MLQKGMYDIETFFKVIDIGLVFYDCGSNLHYHHKLTVRLFFSSWLKFSNFYNIKLKIFSPIWYER